MHVNYSELQQKAVIGLTVKMKLSQILEELATTQKKETMCRLSDEAGRVNEERKWLSQTTSVPGVSMVEELLLNSRPHDEVSRHQEFILDVSDNSALACESYGFTIDVVSCKFLERTKHAGLIYPPSFSQLLAKQGVEFVKHKVNSIFSQCQVADANCILAPVHFERPQH